MNFISSGDRFFLIVAMMFSFLIAVVAAGTTYNIMYEERDKRYLHREVLRSGIIAFILTMLIACALIFGVPHFVSSTTMRNNQVVMPTWLLHAVV